MKTANKWLTRDLNKLVEAQRLWVSEMFDASGKSGERYIYQLVKLSEDVGELSEAVLAKDGLQRAKKLNLEGNNEGIAAEICDVLMVVLVLAEELGIDVDYALSKKIEILEKRRLE